MNARTDLPPLPECRAGNIGSDQRYTAYTEQQMRDYAIAAIEDATGANDPNNYPEAGYEVDAAGTALG